MDNRQVDRDQWDNTDTDKETGVKAELGKTDIEIQTVEQEIQYPSLDIRYKGRGEGGGSIINIMMAKNKRKAIEKTETEKYNIKKKAKKSYRDGKCKGLFHHSPEYNTTPVKSHKDGVLGAILKGK